MHNVFATREFLTKKIISRQYSTTNYFTLSTWTKG